MAEPERILEYKCPCCGAGLVFDQRQQKLYCASCGNTFDIETAQQFNEAMAQAEGPEFSWEEPENTEWSEEEADGMQMFICPSCGGELIADENTAATFCPYCENPAIIRQRLVGGLKPDAVLPFQTTKEDAQRAFLELCKNKPLLPKDYTSEQRLEKITGMYVPFWLYDCSCSDQARYQATRVHTWSDARYHYTRTDFYLLTRDGNAAFDGIPMDGSSKLDDPIMESIEPFDYSKMVDFDTAYLSGFLADKYDVDVKVGHERVKQRVSTTMDAQLMQTCMGYSGVTPTAKQIRVDHGKAKYVLLPVWMLHSRYKDKTYVFAMNGQSGKMTGTFPVSESRSRAWFAGVAAGVAALVSLFLWLL